MPRNTDDFGPVREAELTGPAFDEWNNRKEENNNSEAFSKNFRSNFEDLKPALNEDLARVVNGL